MPQFTVYQNKNSQTKKVQRLEQFQKSGKLALEIPELGYREVVVPPCRVFYRLVQDIAYVVHVCREERSLRRFLIELLVRLHFLVSQIST